MQTQTIKLKIQENDSKPVIYIFEGADAIKQLYIFMKKKYNFNGDGH